MFLEDTPCNTVKTINSMEHNYWFLDSNEETNNEVEKEEFEDSQNEVVDEEEHRELGADLGETLVQN